MDPCIPSATRQYGSTSLRLIDWLSSWAGWTLALRAVGYRNFKGLLRFLLCIIPGLEVGRISLLWLRCYWAQLTLRYGDNLGGPDLMGCRWWSQRDLNFERDSTFKILPLKRGGLSVTEVEGATWLAPESGSQPQQGNGDQSPTTTRKWVLPTTWRSLDIEPWDEDVASQPLACSIMRPQAEDQLRHTRLLTHGNCAIINICLDLSVKCFVTQQ